jgi:hypothetical protein
MSGVGKALRPRGPEGFAPGSMDRAIKKGNGQGSFREGDELDVGSKRT